MKTETRVFSEDKKQSLSFEGILWQADIEERQATADFKFDMVCHYCDGFEFRQFYWEHREDSYGGKVYFPPHKRTIDDILQCDERVLSYGLQFPPPAKYYWYTKDGEEILEEYSKGKREFPERKLIVVKP